jgi:hypothetical protein
MAQQIFVLLTALSAVHEALSGWCFEEKGTGKSVPLDSPLRCQEALAQGAVEWRLGREKRTAYQVHGYIGKPTSPDVEVRVTCGVEPLPLAGVFAPNRLEVLVAAREGGGGAGGSPALVVGGNGSPSDNRPLASRAVLENVLRAAVAMFRPDFGHVGTEAFPRPAQPLSSDGAPVVGWMTYLSAAYPSLPQPPPAPAKVLEVAGLGTLLVAAPELFVDGNDKHLAAVRAVQEALQAAEALVPVHRLARSAAAT